MLTDPKPGDFVYHYKSKCRANCEGVLEPALVLRMAGRSWVRIQKYDKVKERWYITKIPLTAVIRENEYDDE